MKRLLTVLTVLAAMSASAITATKAYVDKRDAETLTTLRGEMENIGSRYLSTQGGSLYGSLILRDLFTPDNGFISGIAGGIGLKEGYGIEFGHGTPGTVGIYYEWSPDLTSAHLIITNDNYYWGEKIANFSDVTAVSNLVGSASADATEALNLASAVSTVVIGEDCQLVSTNYNSATKLPSLFLRFKIPNEETGSNEWHVVWNEMTRWNWFLEDYLPTNYYTKTEIAAELDQKADRAWGYYDSTTGNYAPEGFTWISSPSIAIAGGLAYQRVVTTEGAIWVLESNGMTTITGGETNGFFRISDDKGNAIFEITKGTEVLAGATAGALRTATVDGKTHLYITYNVESSSNPTIEVCTDLKAADWVAETEDSCKANVVWSGSSGAFVAEVYGKEAYNKLFVRASYKKGQKDMITNSAPVGFSEIVIDGVTYKVSVETMNGKKVMVLE